MIHYNSRHFEPQKYQFSAQRQFHTLKHFKYIDKSYLTDLACRCAMSESEIKKRTEGFGSKFHPEFATNPLNAINHTEAGKGYAMEYRTRNENRIEIRLQFDEELFPGGIGYDALVKVGNPKITNPVSQKLKKGFPILFTKGNPAITWEMNLIFGLFEYSYHLITLFPGKYSPAFPDNTKQSDEQYRQSSKFWREHVFLV